MKTLTELGLKHGTDKASLHEYTLIYETYFAPLRDKPIRLLEIGVLNGASLRMWQDYFPNSYILGVDCDDKPELRAEGLNVLKADATKKESWQQIVREMYYETALDPRPDIFDIIIDDGRHSTYSIVQSFTCGFPLLRSGGLYIAEDCHAGFLDEFRRDNHLLSIPESVTPVDFFKGLIDDGVMEKGLNQCGKIASDKTKIKSITFYKSLVIVGKV